VSVEIKGDALGEFALGGKEESIAQLGQMGCETVDPRELAGGRRRVNDLVDRFCLRVQLVERKDGSARILGVFARICGTPGLVYIREVFFRAEEELSPHFEESDREEGTVLFEPIIGVVGGGAPLQTLDTLHTRRMGDEELTMRARFRHIQRFGGVGQQVRGVFWEFDAGG